VSVFNKKDVSATAEYYRVKGLPRRTPTLAPDLAVTLKYKTQTGKMNLFPAQAQALKEMVLAGGAFCPLGVGHGKTIISLLAPTAMQAKRPVLILPAALLKKTERELGELSKHWRIQRNVRLLSYEQLGRVSSAHVLESYRPDLIVLDEAHRAKHKRAGVTRRIVRYMQAHPETRVVAMSGTVMRKSLKDFAHILRWCLKEAAPIPRTEGELEEWADALDNNVNALQKMGPGPLVSLSDVPFTGDPVQTARVAFQRRLLETAGVVSSPEGSVGASIYIRALDYDVSDVTEQNFKRLRADWETPDGWALSQAVDIWRHAKELALGLHYVWDPRPPQEWLNARREWASFVRETLSRSRTLDTELQVANACTRGELSDTEYRLWQKLRGSFKINSKPMWHDDSAMEVVVKWMDKAKSGIVWCEHTFFATELSKVTGKPYFGAEGLDASGKPIESASGIVIASVGSNSTGRNLQKWSKNLVTSPNTSATVWEQLIGRTHRTGQEEDQVEIDFLVGCHEHVDAWEKALSGAIMARDTLGQPQRLLMADVEKHPSLAGKKGSRWQKTVDEKKNILDLLKPSI
jgi:hypothetical protein